MENPVQFVADRILAGAVSKDGSMALIEFVGGDHRLWLTVPVRSLQNLRGLCERLEEMAIDASKGIASQWHVVLHSE
jgi:hypothetical protein